MSALLDQVRESLEGPIVRSGDETWLDDALIRESRPCLCPSQDFVGQKYAEQYAQNVLIPSASIGFVVGWLAQDIRITLGIFGFGVLLALAVSCRIRKTSGPRG